MTDKIEINQMTFYGYHGALPAEKDLGQRFCVDLTLYVDLQPAGDTDDLNQTINYAQVYEVVRQVVEEQRFQLLERLAHQIAQQCIQTFPLEAIRVRVIKPNPPIPGHLGSVAVEITRRSNQ